MRITSSTRQIVKPAINDYPVGRIPHLVFRHLRRLGVIGRYTLRRFLRLRMGRCLVRVASFSLVRLVRIRLMRAMMNHRFVSFSEGAEEKQRQTGNRGLNQEFISPGKEFGGLATSL